MKKLLLVWCALLGAVGAWATVTQPRLTTDADNPVYYSIKNYRSNRYANYAGEAAQLTQVANLSATSLWYFLADGDGVNIVPATAPDLKLATTASATTDGAVWYLKENPYNLGYFYVSLTADGSANCWDDQGSHGLIGTWAPSTSDYDGTSWIVEEVPVTKADVEGGALDFALYKIEILSRLAPLSQLAVYTEANLEAVKNAANEEALATALEAFNTNVTLQCRSGRYLKVGETACSYVAAPSNYEHAIQLVSAGGGAFYLKGFKSKAYVGNVTMSQPINTTETPTTAFYIQSYNGYTVVRPTDTAATYDSYRFIHNGGSGCVGWAAAGENTQHTIADIEIPDYQVLLNGVITEAQAILAKEGVPGYPTQSAMEALTSAVNAALAAYADAAADHETAYNTLQEAIATAWSDVNYTPRTDRYYTIVNTRGAMVYDPSKSDKTDATNGNAEYLWFWDNDNNYRTALAASDVDDTDPNNLWGFVEKEGHYYMYNVGKRQFATVGKGTYGATWIFSNTPAYITLDNGIAHDVIAPNVRVRATVVTTGNSYTMSVSTSYTGPVITYDAANDGGVPMQFTQSALAIDDEVTAVIEALLEDLTPYREALKEVIDLAKGAVGAGLGQYGATDEYNQALAAAEAVYADAEATKSELQNARAALEAVFATLALNMPKADTFLRIKGQTSGQYLAAGSASNGKFNMTNATDATTVFYYDGNILVNLATGLANGMNRTAWSWVNGDEASTVTFSDGSTAGGYGINSGSAYFYDNGDAATPSADRGVVENLASVNLRYRSWSLEEVTTLPISVSAAGYATLYAPVALTPAEGVTVYTISTVADGLAELTEVEGTTIPAKTAVILKAAAGTYDFAVTVDDEPISGNLLQGVTAAKAWTDEFTLQTSDEGVGLFQTAVPYLAGFKAYLPAEKAAGVKGILFDVETAVRAIEATEAADKAAYDLSGRRVEKPVRGLYIVGGKKVLVK